MSYQFHKTDYDVILSKLEETKDWLDKINIKTHDSRFLEVIDYVRLICEHHKKNEVQKLFENYDSEILWWALLESNAFIDVYEAFRNLKDHHLPRANITECLKGPFLPKEEDPIAQNIHGRNILFELQMGARF